MDTETIGKEDWEELQRNLEATIPVYDKVNKVATFGQVSKWRKMVRDRLPKEGRILEIGCGPGSFAEDVLGYDLVCLDPIPEMLRVAEERVNKARAGRTFEVLCPFEIRQHLLRLDGLTRSSRRQRVEVILHRRARVLNAKNLDVIQIRRQR